MCIGATRETYSVTIYNLSKSFKTFVFKIPDLIPNLKIAYSTHLSYKLITFKRHSSELMTSDYADIIKAT